MWRKIKGPVITICIMHLTALLCLIILSIVQCFVDMAEWIKFALAMAVNIVVGLVCGFLLKCCFHRRRFIRVTVVAYWITYVIATVVIDIGESKIFRSFDNTPSGNVFSACFSLKKGLFILIML